MNLSLQVVIAPTKTSQVNDEPQQTNFSTQRSGELKPPRAFAGTASVLYFVLVVKYNVLYVEVCRKVRSIEGKEI